MKYPRYFIGLTLWHPARAECATHKKKCWKSNYSKRKATPTIRYVAKCEDYVALSRKNDMLWLNFIQ